MSKLVKVVAAAIAILASQAYAKEKVDTSLWAEIGCPVRDYKCAQVHAELELARIRDENPEILKDEGREGQEASPREEPEKP